MPNPQPDSYQAESGETVYVGRFGPSDLPAYLASADPLEWVQAAAAPSAGGLAPAVAGSMGTQSNMVNAWCGAFVHAGRFHIHGGGHSDYGGNEIGDADLLHDSPAFDLLIERTPVDDLLGGSNYYADGNPTSRHTYYAMFVVEIGGVPRMLRFNGWMGFAYNGVPVGGDADVRTEDVDGFNLDTNEWEPGAYGPVTTITGSETSCAQDPTTGDVYAWHGANNTIQKYTVATDSCAQVADLSGTEGAGAAMVYDAVNSRLVRFAGRASHKCTYWDGSSKVTPTLIGPDEADISGLSGDNHGWGIAHDTQRNIAWLLSPALDLYRIRLDDFYVEKVTTTGETLTSPTNQIWGRLKYIPEVDGIAYLANWTTPLLVMRCQ